MKKTLIVKVQSAIRNNDNLWMERTEEDFPQLPIGTSICFNESGSTVAEVRRNGGLFDFFKLEAIEYFHSLKTELWILKFEISPIQDVQKTISELEKRGWHLSTDH